MTYVDDKREEIVLIQYYNVLFFLTFQKEVDDFKKDNLAKAIKEGIGMKMWDIYTWCRNHDIPFKTKFIYRDDFPIKVNLWNLYSYYRFKGEIKKARIETL